MAQKECNAYCHRGQRGEKVVDIADAVLDHPASGHRFQVVRKEYDYQHLWTIDVAEALKEPRTGKQRTKGKHYSIHSFSWSPDGSKIAFEATRNPDLIQRGTADIYVLNLADDTVKV